MKTGYDFKVYFYLVGSRNSQCFCRQVGSRQNSSAVNRPILYTVIGGWKRSGKYYILSAVDKVA
jgi:hypothetical protein